MQSFSCFSSKSFSVCWINLTEKRKKLSNKVGVIYTGWERKVHVTPSVDLYSGQILVFSMTLITVCVLSSV